MKKVKNKHFIYSIVTKNYYINTPRIRTNELSKMILFKLEEKYVIIKLNYFYVFNLFYIKYIEKEITILIATYFFIITPKKFSLEIRRIKDNFNSTRIYNFSSRQYTSLKIGREKDCDIIIYKNRLFSKVHCIIQYDYVRNLWYIKDGDGVISSTNGTW